MKYETDAINRLTNIQSEVSTHYFIKNGKVILMVLIHILHGMLGFLIEV